MKKAKSFNNVETWIVTTTIVTIFVLAAYVFGYKGFTPPDNPCIMDNSPGVIVYFDRIVLSNLAKVLFD